MVTTKHLLMSVFDCRSFKSSRVCRTMMSTGESWKPLCRYLASIKKLTGCYTTSCSVCIALLECVSTCGYLQWLLQLGLRVGVIKLSGLVKTILSWCHSDIRKEHLCFDINLVSLTEYLIIVILIKFIQSIWYTFLALINWMCRNMFTKPPNNLLL